ncbi:MAG: 5'/3'-nucleotidase SurE [Prevotellaceae bacterium]|jgi:5'-nucleotidase|nr:5'/3'-nucleotidase SurE [Prevotellaceae bacterium]
MKKRLIFITNDDGYRASGITTLIEMMRPYGDIVVVAPAEGQSGMSSALTVKTPVRLRKIKEESGLCIYACKGTPADCVKLAMSHVFTRKPDLLVSGINHGANTSISVIYSGTLGAAAEGTLYEIPSIGFSLANDYATDFAVCIPYGRKIIEQVMKVPFDKRTFLNVNIPDLPLNEIKGIKFCRQNRGAWIEEFEKRTDPHGFDYYWMTGIYKNHEEEAGDTDENAVLNGYVAIVPHHLDMTDYRELERLKQVWELK